MVRDLLEYLVAVIVFQLVSIGIPGFVLAWRVGTGRPWLALVPVLMFAKITDSGHQALRQKVINGVVLGLLFPIALAVPASLNAREAAPYETGTTSDEVYWGLASTVSLVVCLGVWMAMWDGVCRATGQNTRKVWLFFVPLVNFAMPWVIALQAKRLGGFGGKSLIGGREADASTGASPLAPRRQEEAGVRANQPRTWPITEEHGAGYERQRLPCGYSAISLYWRCSSASCSGNRVSLVHQPTSGRPLRLPLQHQPLSLIEWWVSSSDVTRSMTGPFGSLPETAVLPRRRLILRGS